MSEAFPTAAVLSLSGGLQDAYTYLYRGEVFANAQTGNIVLLSVNLMEHQWMQALRYIIPLSAFALGIVAAEIVHSLLQQSERVHWRQVVLVIEILLLAIVGFMPQTYSVNILANAMVSFSCAMQVQAFRKVTGYAFASTMCIGNMRSAMESLYGGLRAHNHQALRKSLRYWEIIVLFGLGAGVGGHFIATFGARTIWASCGLLVIGCLLMFIREENSEKHGA